MARLRTSTYVATYRWDASADPKTAGAKVLRGPKLPAGAVVTDALVIVDTPLAGGTATDTVSLGTGESAADISSATARNNALWAGAGAKRGALTATGAPAKMTQDRAPTFTINGTALTGGKFRVVLTVVDVV